MIRLVEVAFFLAPLAVFLLWRKAMARGLPGPSPRILAAAIVVLLGMGAAMLALAEHDRLPPGRYVPAQVLNGQIVPGHSE